MVGCGPANVSALTCGRNGNGGDDAAGTPKRGGPRREPPRGASSRVCARQVQRHVSRQHTSATTALAETRQCGERSSGFGLISGCCSGLVCSALPPAARYRCAPPPRHRTGHAEGGTSSTRLGDRDPPESECQPGCCVTGASGSGSDLDSGRPSLGVRSAGESCATRNRQPNLSEGSPANVSALTCGRNGNGKPRDASSPTRAAGAKRTRREGSHPLSSPSGSAACYPAAHVSDH